jgi:hypothetical protein
MIVSFRGNDGMRPLSGSRLICASWVVEPTGRSPLSPLLSSLSCARVVVSTLSYFAHATFVSFPSVHSLVAILLLSSVSWCVFLSINLEEIPLRWLESIRVQGRLQISRAHLVFVRYFNHHAATSDCGYRFASQQPYRLC